MTSIETTPQLVTSAEKKTGLVVDQSGGQTTGGALLKDNDDSKISDGNLKKSNSEMEESSNAIQSSAVQSASFEKVSKPISNKTVEDVVARQSNTDQSESIELDSKPISKEAVEDGVARQSSNQSESIELESKPISNEIVEDGVAHHSSTDQSESIELESKPISIESAEDSVVRRSSNQSESIELESKPISNEIVDDDVAHHSSIDQSESIELESKPISDETVEDDTVHQSSVDQSDSSNKTLANEKSEISGLSTPVVVIVDEIQEEEEEEDNSKSDSCKKDAEEEEEEDVKEKIEVIKDSSILVSQSGKVQLSNCKESNIPAEPQAKVSSVVSEQKPPIARNRKSTGKLTETAPARPAAPVVYPGDLNPFGDDEEEEKVEEEPVPKSRNTKQQQQSSIAKVHYPIDLNPFGDEPETEAKPTGLSLSRSPSASASLNPFGSDEEDEEEALSCHSLTPMPSPVPRKSLMNGGGDGGSRNGFSTPSPTAPHKSSRVKKRQAPAPPPSPLSRSAVSLGTPNNPSNNEDTGSISSHASSVSQSRTPTPVPRQSKQGQLLLPPVSPAPGRRRPCSPPSPTLHQMPALPKPDSVNESQLCTVGARMKAIKSKKRPAPPIPAYRRCIKSSVAEMELELEKIGDELPTVEKRRKELEQWLIDNRFAADQDTSTTAAESESSEGLEQKKKDEDELDQLYKKSALEFIELAKHRCKLARKQKELMYMKREHKLEETQADIEFRLRVIMSKQDVHKTPEDKQDEKELLDRLMEIIDERNDIIENMIRDENREIEEYQLIVSKVIPAETQQPQQPAKPADPDFETLHRHKSHKPHQHHSLSSFLKLKKKKKDKNKKKETKEEDHSSNGLDEVDGDSERVSLADQSAGSVSNLTNTSSDTSLNSRTAPDHKDQDSQGPAQSPNDDPPGKDKSKKHHKHFTLSKSTLKKLSPMHAAADLIHRKKEAKNTTTGGPATVTAPAPATGQTTN